MRSTRIIPGLFLVLALGACSMFGGEPDISGDYEIQAMADGSPVSALISLVKGADGRYQGSLETGMLPTMRFTSVVREGDGWALRAAGPDGTLYMTMFVDGDEVEGDWSMAGMGGDFTGVKVER